MITTILPRTEKFTRPTTEPIHMSGEADAFPGETFENAYERLFAYGCECGWMTTNQIDLGTGRVFVYNNGDYRLDFADCKTLTSVWKYAGVSRGWVCLWAA